MCIFIIPGRERGGKETGMPLRTAVFVKNSCGGCNLFEAKALH